MSNTTTLEPQAEKIRLPLIEHDGILTNSYRSQFPHKLDEFDTTQESKLVATKRVTMEAAVVVPTLNERDNIPPLLEGILKADSRLHVIVVDDGSSDGTAQLVTATSEKY